MKLNKSIVFLIALLFLFTTYSLAQVNKSENKKKDDNKEVVDEYIVENRDDFIALFSELNKLPEIKDLKEISFTENSKKVYSTFSSYIQWELFNDASDETWYYQPVGKYKFNKTDYILFLAEERNGIVTISTMLWYPLKSGTALSTDGMPKLMKINGNQSTGFEFLSNKVDSVIVYLDFEKKQSNLYVLGTTFFENSRSLEYYNMNKLVKLTNKSIVPDYNFKEFCSLFPKIDDNWNSENLIASLLHEKSNDNFSFFLHKETRMVSTHTLDSVEFIARYSPLGYKQINDTIHFFVLFNHNPESTEGNIKLLLIKSLNDIIDLRELTNAAYHHSRFTLNNDILNFDIEHGDTESLDNQNNKLKLLITPSGFLAEKSSFDSWSNVKLNYPVTLCEGSIPEYIMDASFIEIYGINSFNIEEGISYLGKLETNRFNVLLLNESYVVTNGAHESYSQATAYIFEKSTYRFVDELFLYTSSSGNGGVSWFYPGEFYTCEDAESLDLSEPPQKEYLSKLLTNEGFLEKEYVIKRQTQSTLPKGDILSLLQAIKLPVKYKPVDIKEARQQITKNDRYLSNVIDSLLYIDQQVEPYLSLYVVKGKIELSKNKSLIIWQSWKDTKTYRRIEPTLNAAVYNTNTKRFDKVIELSFYETITNEIIKKYAL